MKTPVISYVVPVYNARPYLRACVDSILGQHGELPFELILVEDGSTDGSAELCRTFATSPDVVLIEPGHGGVSRARNAGIAQARGEFIVLVDADDLLAPDFTITLYKIAKKTGADIVCCGLYRGREPKFDGDIKDHLRVYDAYTALKWMLYQRNGIECSPCAKLYKRDVVVDNPFLPDRRYEDLEWSPRVFIRAYLGGVAVTSRRLYFYRDHDSSFINIRSVDRLDVLDMVERVREFVFRLSDPALATAVNERMFSANYNMFLLFKYDRDISNRCWRVIRRYRFKSLTGRHVRLKSRLGALLSYLGPGVVGLFAPNQ